MRQFAERLSGVAALVDWDGSWFREFWQRDAEGMRACLEGREVPPWDVIDSLLQDLAAVSGAENARHEAARLRPLHRASVRAYDRADGVKATLTERLRILREEQQRSTRRLQDLQKFSASVTGMDDLQAVESELAWARDYYARICSRIAELRGRVAALEQLETESFRLPPQDPWPSASSVRSALSSPPDPPSVTAAAAATAAPGQRRKRRERGSARFAGAGQDVDVKDEGGSAAAEAGADLVTGTVAGPRGARFSGAPTTGSVANFAAPVLPGVGGASAAGSGGARFVGAAGATPVARVAPAVDATDRAAVTRTVGMLRQLRAEDNGGQAHAVLAEAVHQPAARFPLLAEQLERAGMAADWATLLWEAAALPLDLVLAAADALSASGRTADGEQLLRLGMGRSAVDVGSAVAELVAEARYEEARAVLDIYLRTRATSESARVALADPAHLVPLVLDVALSISSGFHEDLVLSLRVAGMRAEVSAALSQAR
ncbi:hypothetical protein ACEZCY_02680 [Streptacidiphilus sp. N1-12]|uniref:Uncharacterized protein n=2 Tax=Streptacidiphilus alkalitolerans TaxID=3342712 RepID=A0ABV6V3A9_9ACTN